MHLPKKIAKAIAISFALFIASVTLTVMQAQPIQAQISTIQPTSGPVPTGVTVDQYFEIDAFLSARPTVVGLGQPILVNFWITRAPNQDRFALDYKVTITRPDKTTDVITMKSYEDDGTQYFEYVPDQLGDWKLKFDFPGTYFPAGRYLNGYIVTNTSGTNYATSQYYKPSSTPETTITVQQDMVYSWPEIPLPTDYWTRPLISVLNREWWPIAGNWPAYGDLTGGGLLYQSYYPDTSPYWSHRYVFTPWVQGPNSAHIVWKRLGAIAGFVGSAPSLNTTSSAGGPSLIYVGRCYQTMTVPVNGVPTSCAVCYDLRTGEQYYAIPTAQGGTTPSVIAYSGSSAQLIAFSGNRMLKINPLTGAVTTNVTLPGSLTSAGSYYMNQYCMTVQTLGSGANATYRLINWTTAGNGAIVSNITWPTSRSPTGATACLDQEDGVVSYSARVAGGVSLDETGTSLMVVDLKTGAVLWNITDPDIGYDPFQCTISDHGKWAVLFMKGTWKVRDVRTGKLVYETERMDYPWDASSFGAYSDASAYGMFFRFAYSGVYAFNWTNGKIVWKYEAPAFSPFETPYTGKNGTTVYSFNAGCQIADGKMYIVNTEHTPTTPRTRGWSLHCINITTGEGIWRITGEQTPTAIADGYLVAPNTYDGYMYVYGKGKSVTTVTAPDVVIPMGTGVVIKGTVLDASPAQPGTPCVSKESMTTQMEYLHQQRPIGGLLGNETITGVPVILTAIGSDGTVIDIGTTTTNGYYGTFGYTWTPPKEDTYTIMATFAGDNSYGSSSAATTLSVGPAPASPTPTPTPQPQAQPDNTPIFYAIIAAAVATIVAVALVGIMLYRKRP